MAMACRDWDDWLFLLSGAHAPFRVSEMLALTWHDVSLRCGHLTVSLGKGSKSVGVTMSDEF